MFYWKCFSFIDDISNDPLLARAWVQEYGLQEYITFVKVSPALCKITMKIWSDISMFWHDSQHHNPLIILSWIAQYAVANSMDLRASCNPYKPLGIIQLHEGLSVIYM